MRVKKTLIVDPKEPIYITSRVLRKALAKYESVETGHQREALVGATVQFMNLIELHFNNKLNLYGREPLEKVMVYHNGVKSFINGIKIWKTCNKDRKQQLRNNKVFKEFEHPNFEAEIINKYQNYLESPKRLTQIRKIVHFSRKEVPKPTNKEMNECSKIAMGEMITSTGCRPVVAYRMCVGAYASKKPGFNPYQVSKDDCVVEEEHGQKKICRRVDPYLPPKHLACQHQLDNNSAVCPMECEKRCIPEGFNIYFDWDKTRDTNGPSYLHLAKPIKDLLDLYDIIKL